jgi:hypothetical protein
VDRAPPRSPQYRTALTWRRTELKAVERSVIEAFGRQGDGHCHDQSSRRSIWESRTGISVNLQFFWGIRQGATQLKPT